MALLVVDVQRDFCPGGALAVKGGDKVVPKLNRAIDAARRAGLPIFFTRDWHPANHASFREQGGIWPRHCVRDTAGAELHPDLLVPEGSTVISKGVKADAEGYSAFQGTRLAGRLDAKGVHEIYIGGLTTDYCVKQSALDAIEAGFSVDVMADCTRAVNTKRGDGVRALTEMQRKGARIVTVAAFERAIGRRAAL